MFKVGSGNSEFGGQVSFLGSASNAGNGGAPFMLWSKTTNYLWFSDNASLFMGFGQDLELSHDGSDSLIRDKRTTGSVLRIGADKLWLQNKDGNEPYIECIDNGSVKYIMTSLLLWRRLRLDCN